MLSILILVICLALLAIAAFTDLKTLEVPDWANYGGIGLGIGIHAISSVVQLSWWPIIYSIAGLSAGFAIGCLMYYTGQWGGGDAKLLMAIGALIGAQWRLDSFGLAFLTNLLLIGAAWGLLFLIFLAIKNHRRTFKIFRTLRAQESKTQLIAAITAGITIVLAFLFKAFAIPLVALGLSAYLIVNLLLLVKSVELTSMHKWVTPEQLVEGDWLVHEVAIKGKKIAGPSKTGLTKKQIAELQSHKLEKLCVRYGIPFTPAFLLAFLVTLAAGNLILRAIHL